MTPRFDPSLIFVERVDNQWGVVFYPFIGCDISQAMLLSSHRLIEFAQRYRKQFVETLTDYENHK